MGNWGFKQKLIQLKREHGQVGRKLQDLIDALDGNKKTPNNNSREHMNQNRKNFHYREDR